MAIGFYRTSRTQWATQHQHQHNLISKWLIQGIYWKIKLLSHCGYISFSSAGKKKTKLTFGICFSHVKDRHKKHMHTHIPYSRWALAHPANYNPEKKNNISGQCFGNGCLHMKYTNRYTHYIDSRELYGGMDKDICFLFISFLLACSPPCFCFWIHSDAGKLMH